MKNPWILFPLLALGAASCSTTEQQIAQVLAADSSGRAMDYRLLAELPEPVQRYFRYAVPDGHPAITTVQLEHGGRFRRSQDSDWEAISGRQYFDATRPEFLWIGTTSLFQAHDAYINDSGSLKVYLFSRLRIVNERGAHMDQGELLRWLGEAVWFPTALLPHETESSRLTWSAIDAETARLEFSYNGIDVWYRVEFAPDGRITRLQTERYMSEGRLETWEGRVDDYREVDGLMVPHSIEGAWLLPEGRYAYADFSVQRILYNQAENRIE